MIRLLQRLWHSPTFTTWASFGARTLNLVLVLPLVLRWFSPAEAALWQVFSVLIGLQLLADLGFSNTFARLVAYAMGGAVDLRQFAPRALTTSTTEPNWVLLARICATMRLIYGRLGWLLGSMLLVGGTLALVRRVGALSEPAGALAELGSSQSSAMHAWLAWVVILVSTVVNFRGSSYGAFLQGTNQIALVRRWEALFGVGSIVTSFVALISGGGLLALVCANQIWTVLSAWRNYCLARQVLDGRFRLFPLPRMDPEVFVAVWTPAWRSAVGVFMSFGLVQISGLVYAQSEDSLAVASYLLGMRLVQTVSQISQAPFYSKLPMLARLWAQGRVAEQIALAERGMTWAYWTFVLPFVVLGLFGPWLLALINSQTPFPPAALWAVLGVAYLFERYGAMHLQLYSTTNHIMWHVANGVSGFIFAAIAFWTFPHFDVLALPLGMLAGNAGFYSWYSSSLSHRKFSLAWPGYDLRTVGWPSACLTIYLISVLLLSSE